MVVASDRRPGSAQWMIRTHVRCGVEAPSRSFENQRFAPPNSYGVDIIVSRLCPRCPTHQVPHLSLDNNSNSGIRNALIRANLCEPRTCVPETASRKINTLDHQVCETFLSIFGSFQRKTTELANHESSALTCAAKAEPRSRILSLCTLVQWKTTSSRRNASDESRW